MFCRSGRHQRIIRRKHPRRRLEHRRELRDVAARIAGEPRWVVAHRIAEDRRAVFLLLRRRWNAEVSQLTIEASEVCVPPGPGEGIAQLPSPQFALLLLVFEGPRRIHRLRHLRRHRP